LVSGDNPVPVVTKLPPVRLDQVPDGGQRDLVELRHLSRHRHPVPGESRERLHLVENVGSLDQPRTLGLAVDDLDNLFHYVPSCIGVLHWLSVPHVGIEPTPRTSQRVSSKQGLGSRVLVACRVPCVGSGSSNLSFALRPPLFTEEWSGLIQLSICWPGFPVSHPGWPDTKNFTGSSAACQTSVTGSL